MWRRLGIVSLVGALLSGCWLQPGFDARHSRANDLERTLTIDNVNTLDQVWSARVGVPEATNQVELHEPLVRGGRVYVSFRETSFLFGRRHGVTAFGSTGTPMWTRYGFATDGAAYSTPATLVDDALYTSWGMAGGGAPCAFRFERLDPDDGTVRSTQNTFVMGTTHSRDFITFTGRAPCSAASDLVLSVRGVDDAASRFFTRLPLTIFEDPVATASGDAIFVVTGGALHAVDAQGCGATTCPPVWSTTNLDLDGNVPPVLTPAATGSPRAFVITRGSRELLAIDTTSGTIDWRAPLSGSAVSDLALANGTVFVVASGGTGSAADAVQAFAAGGCGQPVCTASWHTAPGTANAAVAPVVAGSVLYVGSRGDVRAYDASGCGSTTCEPVTTVSLGDGVEVQQIVVAEGRLYVATLAQITVLGPS